MLGRQEVAIAYLSLRTAAPFVRHSSAVSSSVMSASTSPTDADEKVDIISDIDASCAAGKCVRFA